jgi:hypothetical protein
MEFTNIEVSVIEQTTIAADNSHAIELDDLQLAFVAGGNHLVTCG